MTSFRPAPRWLADAVFYQIYPQSFADSNGDGIGDFDGIAERLDHLAWLGVNTVWLNPCFVSPFRDAGYDVSDYLNTAPRYGSNDDLAKLVDEARSRGIRVLLDLVAGHTSDQHPWFTASADDPADDRYIWAAEGPDGGRPDGFVDSPGTRPGAYLPNFFAFQPALNFGYARENPAEPWRQPVDAEGPRANRAALRAVMDHWLGLGLSGFRVDMAASLVKDDPGKTETAGIWTELRHWLDDTHPDAVLLSEWGEPEVSVPAGFHTDFFLQFGGPTDGRALRSLWSNTEGTVNESWDPLDCFFDPSGQGTPGLFVEAWHKASAAVAGSGFISLPTANHDFSRLNCGPAQPNSSPPPSPSSSPGRLSRRSTTATRSACATSRVSPTRRAACWARATTARAPAPRCSGTTARTPVSPPPPPTASTSLSIRHRTAPRSRHSVPTRPRCSISYAASSTCAPRHRSSAPAARWKSCTPATRSCTYGAGGTSSSSILSGRR